MRGESMTKKLVAGVSVLFLLLGAACGGDDGGSDDTTTESSDTGSDTTEDSGGGSVELAASNFAFEPGDLSAAAGDTIEFTNDDDAPHTFTAADAGIDEEVDAGGSTSISLADVDPGSYDFVCKIHPDMTGTLEVTE
jgi:plastocyanin